MSFYDNYVRLCNSVGKSPSAVAIDLKLGKPSVTRWKNGTEPRDATVQKIADYFGVSAAHLRGEETKKEQPTVSDGLSLDGVSEEDIKTIKAYLSMPEDQRKALAKLLGIFE